jgi:hypothetical protein
LVFKSDTFDITNLVDIKDVEVKRPDVKSKLISNIKQQELF